MEFSHVFTFNIVSLLHCHGESFTAAFLYISMGFLQKRLCKNCKKNGELVENTLEGYIYCSNCGLINGEVLDSSGGKEGLQSGNRADFADATDELLQEEMSVDIDRALERDFRMQKQVLYGHTAKIGLPGSIADAALRLYAKYVNYRKRRGERMRLKDEAIAASILEASSDAGVTISMQEIIHAMRFPDHAQRRVIMNITRLRHLLFDLQGKEVAAPTPLEASFNLKLQYKEYLERARARLMIPGLWTTHIGAALAEMLENEMDDVPGQGVVCAYLVYLFLTTKAFAALCGIREKLVVPLNSPGAPVVRDRLAKHFAVTWKEVEGLTESIDAEIMQRLLTLATHEGTQARQEWEKDHGGQAPTHTPLPERIGVHM